MEKTRNSGYPRGVESHLTCSMCGADVGEDAKLCAACGAIIVPRSEPPPAPVPTSESGAGRAWLLVGAILAAVVVVGAVLVRGGASTAPPTVEELRSAREALELEWETKRDRYFALAARVDLVEREDMDHRRVLLSAGAWAKLSEAEQRELVDLLALKTSVRLAEAKRGKLELVEGSTVVARYEPGRGAVFP